MVCEERACDASYVAAGFADASLTLPGGVELPYTLDFTSMGTEVYGTAYGTRSGAAPLHATFATQRTGPDVVASCGGSGAGKVPMDMTFTSVQQSSRRAPVRLVPPRVRRCVSAPPTCGQSG